MAATSNAPPKAKSFSWRQIVISANPQWRKESRRVVEYEFSASDKNGDRRTFSADYQNRGAYADELSDISTHGTN